MQIDTNELLEEIFNFRFSTSNGEHFWAPYLRNGDNSENPSLPRGIGKTSWQDIEKSIEYIKTNYPDLSGEEIRKKLVDGSLPIKDMNYKAIDCSGFVFHVFNSIYEKKFGYGLDATLSVEKENVLNGAENFSEWRDKHIISTEEKNSLPNNVPLKWVCDTFGRKAVNLCNVSGMTSTHSSIKITNLDDVHCGDLVRLGTSGSDIPHIAVVLTIAGKKALIAHSERVDNTELGGVTIEEVMLENKKYIECKNSTRLFGGIYRLRTKPL